MTTYVRLYYHDRDGRRVRTWAISKGRGQFGCRFERVFFDGSSNRERLLIKEQDIITETTARMNLDGELEIEGSKS